MKGNPNVIATLQAGLPREAQLNLQCRLNAQCLKHLGINGLACKIKKLGNHAHDYLKALTTRVLFLEGDPSYAPPSIAEAASVTDLLKSLLALHLAIVAPYEEAVQVGQKALDDTTRNLFEHLLKWHQQDIAWIEKQLRLIDTLGESAYITSKI